MRVLLASNYPHLPEIQGGLQTTTHDLCLAIKELGAEVAVLCGSEGMGTEGQSVSSDKSLGYLVMRSRMPEQALASIASIWEPTAIVVQTGSSLLPMVLASLATACPTAVYLHNVETHQLAGSLVPDPSLLYFANSAFTADRWRALCGINCTVVPPIVAAERYQVAKTGEQILFVNPHPIKGGEILFSLAEACPELPFVVYESWNIAPMWRDYCMARAQKLGNIEWHEPVFDMREAYAKARILLMPSIWEESFGRTVVEAQLNGIPVLSSNRGALPALVGESGIVLDPHAPIDDWARALRTLYATAPAYSNTARQLGMRHASATPLIAAEFLTALAAHATALASA